MKFLFRMLVLNVSLICLISCRGTYSPPLPIPSNVAAFDKPALSYSGLYQLKIIPTTQGQIEGINFQILSAKSGDVLFDPRAFFRTRDMVVVLWDSKDRVWIYSGDVGTTIWENIDGEKEWKMKNYDSQTDIPPEYLKAIRPKIFSP